MGWKTLEREIILTTPYMGIVREKALTGRGKIVEDYYIVNKGDVAMALPIIEDGKVILVREYHHGCKDYVWQLPAGTVGFGETPRGAAERELLEETGYAAASWELLGWWYINSQRMPDRLFIFVARDVHHVGPSHPDATEEIVTREFSWNDAIRKVLAGEIKDPHSCTALLWVERMPQ